MEVRSRGRDESRPQTSAGERRGQRGGLDPRSAGQWIARHRTTRGAFASAVMRRARVASHDRVGFGAPIEGAGKWVRQENSTDAQIANSTEGPRTFFHDVLQPGVVVRRRPALDAVHDVACFWVIERFNGQRRFEEDACSGPCWRPKRRSRVCLERRFETIGQGGCRRAARRVDRA